MNNFRDFVVAKILKDPQHWLDIDVMRSLKYPIFEDSNDNFLELDDTVNDIQIKQKVRNFFLWKIGVYCDIIWQERLNVDNKTFAWVNSLKLRKFDADELEWFVLLVAYSDYLVKNNLKDFICNFPSFKNLYSFYNILNFALNNCSVSKLCLSRLFDSECAALDDLIIDVCSRATGYITPNEDSLKKIIAEDKNIHHFLNYQEQVQQNLTFLNFAELKNLLVHVESLTQSKDRDAFNVFIEMNLPRILSCPTIIINSLILLLSGAKEDKQRSSFFRDLMKIAARTNPHAHKSPILSYPNKRKSNMTNSTRK